MKLAYQLGQTEGRRFVRGALIFPGIRMGDLEKVAKGTGDDVKELVAKRDAMLDAITDFLEELMDVDKD